MLNINAFNYFLYQIYGLYYEYVPQTITGTIIGSNITQCFFLNDVLKSL